MPNWCQNSILIPLSKKKDLIRKFTRTVRPRHENEKPSKWLDFNRIIPMPMSEKDNWYDWSCENWGTKWNARYSQFYVHENGIGQNTKLFSANTPVLEISFDTAWSPASDEIMRILCERLGCAVEHAALEEGMDINFICTYELDDDGEIMQEEYFGHYNEDEYRIILARFYGGDEYVQEIIDRRNDNIK